MADIIVFPQRQRPLTAGPNQAAPCGGGHPQLPPPDWRGPRLVAGQDVTANPPASASPDGEPLA